MDDENFESAEAIEDYCCNLFKKVKHLQCNPLKRKNELL